jgi:hypothetical protein
LTIATAAVVGIGGLVAIAAIDQAVDDSGVAPPVVIVDPDPDDGTDSTDTTDATGSTDDGSTGSTASTGT